MELSTTSCYKCPEIETGKHIYSCHHTIESYPTIYEKTKELLEVQLKINSNYVNNRYNVHFPPDFPKLILDTLGIQFNTFLQNPQALGIASIAARDTLRETIHNIYGLPDITWIYEQAIGSFTLAFHTIVWIPRTAHMMKENRRNKKARPELEEITTEVPSSSLSTNENQPRNQNDSSDYIPNTSPKTPARPARPACPISSPPSSHLSFPAVRRTLRPESQYKSWLFNLYKLYQIDTRSISDRAFPESPSTRSSSPEVPIDLNQSSASDTPASSSANPKEPTIIESPTPKKKRKRRISLSAHNKRIKLQPAEPQPAPSPASVSPIPQHTSPINPVIITRQLRDRAKLPTPVYKALSSFLTSSPAAPPTRNPAITTTRLRNRKKLKTPVYKDLSTFLTDITSPAPSPTRNRTPNPYEDHTPLATVIIPQIITPFQIAIPQEAERNRPRTEPTSKTNNTKRPKTPDAHKRGKSISTTSPATPKNNTNIETPAAPKVTRVIAIDPVPKKRSLSPPPTLPPAKKCKKTLQTPIPANQNQHLNNNPAAQQESLLKNPMPPRNLPPDK
jgi:hypothetical protein